MILRRSPFPLLLVPASSLTWSNQLRRLFFAASRLPREHSFRLLQFQKMDLFCSSANSRVLPYSPCSGKGDEEHSYNGDHIPDVIMVGSIAVYLKRKGYEHNSLLSSSVHKFDGSELGRDREGTSANVQNSNHEDECPPASTQDSKRSCTDISLKRGLGNNSNESNNRNSFQVGRSQLSNNNSRQDESYLPSQFEKKSEQFYFKKRQSVDISSKNSLVTNNLPPFQPFNICPFERRVNAKPGASKWHVKHSYSGRIMEHVAEATNIIVLRPGMILLKHYITQHEQVNIVKICQNLGLGPGGFYQPGYKDGAKLRLQMMCLGLDWDPQTRKYESKRAVDGFEPPDIPPEFATLVSKALEDAHASIKNVCNTSNTEAILPSMSPDICIVNFYKTNGRLGLHQDRDESKESLVLGLPVVSFSLGNSAEFLYGDQRDVDKAERVVLESGDVLIFGGESRHIYHGVSSIIPKSTPKFLLNHTGLRPGRLNLTFRKSQKIVKILEFYEPSCMAVIVVDECKCNINVIFYSGMIGKFEHLSGREYRLKVV